MEYVAAQKAHAPPGLKKVNPNKQPPSSKAAPKVTPQPSGSKKQTERTTAQKTDTLEMDMAGLNIVKPEDSQPAEEPPPPKITIARERILEEARKEATAGDAEGRKRLSLVVIGSLLFFINLKALNTPV